MNQSAGGSDSEDAYYDPALDMVITRSGRARWRQRMTAWRVNRSPAARAETLTRLGLDPNRPVRTFRRYPGPGRGGYAGPMRRPDIELSDEVATYVEQHPDVIARLAGQDYGPTSQPDDADRARFRSYARDKMIHAASDEGRAAGQAFLARYSG